MIVSGFCRTHANCHLPPNPPLVTRQDQFYFCCVPSAHLNQSFLTNNIWTNLHREASRTFPRQYNYHIVFFSSSFFTVRPNREMRARPLQSFRVKKCATCWKRKRRSFCTTQLSNSHHICDLHAVHPAGTSNLVGEDTDGHVGKMQNHVGYTEQPSHSAVNAWGCGFPLCCKDVFRSLHIRLPISNGSSVVSVTVTNSIDLIVEWSVTYFPKATCTTEAILLKIDALY